MTSVKIETYKDISKILAVSILDNIDVRLADCIANSKRFESVFSTSKDITFVGDLLRNEDHDIFTVKTENGNKDVEFIYDVQESIDVKTIIEQSTPSNLDVILKTSIVGTPFDQINAEDMAAVKKQGISMAEAAYRKSCKVFGKFLHKELEINYGIITKSDIIEGEFRICGYFHKNKTGGLGEPIWANPEFSADYVNTKCGRPLVRAAEKSIEANEMMTSFVGTASQPAFQSRLSSFSSQMGVISKGITTFIKGYKAIMTPNGKQMLMKSSVTAIDDIEETEDKE